MLRAPHEVSVYTNELRKLGHGLPLYDPDPRGQYDKVRIGDVGYVDEFGSFHRIFNIFHKKKHPINQSRGTPSSFIPLQGWLYAISRRTPLPAGPISPEHVVVSKTGSGALGLQTSSDTTTFSVRDQQGAALVITHPTSRVDTLYGQAMKKYMLLFHDSWMSFIRDKLKYRIDLQDIILVTSSDQVTDWARVILMEGNTQCKIGYTMDDPSSESANSRPHIVWEIEKSSSSVSVQYGPIIDETQANIPTQFDMSGCTPDPEKNQCIFLRGYHIRKRTRITESAELSSASNQYDNDKGNTVSRPLSQNEDAFFDCMFARAGADLAIVHDNEIGQIMKEYAHYIQPDNNDLPLSSFLELKCFDVVSNRVVNQEEIDWISTHSTTELQSIMGKKVASIALDSIDANFDNVRGPGAPLSLGASILAPSIVNIHGIQDYDQVAAHSHALRQALRQVQLSHLLRDADNGSNCISGSSEKLSE